MKRISLLVGVVMVFVIAGGLFARSIDETEGTRTAILTDSGYPISTETITQEIVSILSHKNFTHDGMMYYDMLEAETNVHIEWREIQEEAYPEKKNLIFASGDYPDAFLHWKTVDPADILTHAPQGVFAPIEDLLDTYAVNMNSMLKDRPFIRAAIQAPDGHVYSMPTLQEEGTEPQLHFFINKKWLDNLGLEIPQDYDEFREVLRAFKNGDPNGNGEADEIPFSFRTFGWLGVYPLFSSFGIDRQHHLGEEFGITIDQDDPTKVVFGAATDEYKEGIEYFHGLYAEGLVDVEAFTHSYAALTAKQQQQDPAILGAHLGWSAAYLYGESGDSEYVTLDPLEGPAGKRYPGDPPKYFLTGFTVTSKSEYPEALVRWADLQYEPTWALQSWFGIIGEQILEVGDGTYMHADVPAGYDDRISWSNQFAPRGSSLVALPVDVFTLMEPTADLMDKFAGFKQYEPYIEDYILFPLVYTLESENDEIVDLKPEISQYVQEMGAKWIVDGGIESDWQAYLQTLENMRLPRLVEIYQTIYDRQLSE